MDPDPDPGGPKTWIRVGIRIRNTAPNGFCSRMAECGVNISLSCLESYTAEELDTKLIPFKQRQFRELQAEAQHIQVPVRYATEVVGHGLNNYKDTKP
jgi:hypothetical protein